MESITSVFDWEFDSFLEASALRLGTQKAFESVNMAFALAAAAAAAA